MYSDMNLNIMIFCFLIKDKSPLEKMKKSLLGEPTLDELSALPVANVWHQLGLWLGLDEQQLQSIKHSYEPEVRHVHMFTAFLCMTQNTAEYREFIDSLQLEKKIVFEELCSKYHPHQAKVYREIIHELGELEQ